MRGCGNGWCQLMIVVDGVRITVFGVVMMMVIGACGDDEIDDKSVGGGVKCWWYCMVEAVVMLDGTSGGPYAYYERECVCLGEEKGRSGVMWHNLWVPRV